MEAIFNFNESLFQFFYFFIPNGVGILCFIFLVGVIAIPFLGTIVGLVNLLTLWIKKISSSKDKRLEIQLINKIKIHRMKGVLLVCLSGFFLLLSLISPIITINNNNFPGIVKNPDSTKNLYKSDYVYLKNLGYNFDDGLESKKVIGKYWIHANENKDTLEIPSYFSFNSEFHLGYSVQSRNIYETFNDSIRKDSIQVYNKSTISMHGIYPLWRFVTNVMRTGAFQEKFSVGTILHKNQEDIFVFSFLDKSFTNEYIINQIFLTGELPLFSDNSDRLTYILYFIFFGGFVVLIIILGYTLIIYILFYFGIIFSVKKTSKLILWEIDLPKRLGKFFLILFVSMLVSVFLTGNIFEIRYGLIFLIISMLLVSKVSRSYIEKK